MAERMRADDPVGCQAMGACNSSTAGLVDASKNPDSIPGKPEVLEHHIEPASSVRSARPPAKV